MLGPDQPVILHLLDIEPAKAALEGVKMELLDAAFPLLKGEQEPGGFSIELEALFHGLGSSSSGATLRIHHVCRSQGLSLRWTQQWPARTWTSLSW